MLPLWLSDLRGALLALLCASILDCCGLRCRACLAVLTGACAAGLAFSVAFYAHTTRTVFNRNPTWRLRPFLEHLWVTRPLEALWRLLTAPLRSQPDFVIVGEVRTGTTSLASHLREMGCVGPFSPWIVPLASDKESFYFAGHYMGFVHPYWYRMCFPLSPVQWIRRELFGHQPVPIFDACASHLNTPWAAQLLRQAAPRAKVVVLIRPPEQQNVSWWRLEMGAHAWARDMGMTEDFLLPGYPPRTFQEALELSRSAGIRALYEEGELAGARIAAASNAVERIHLSLLPRRLLPFPGGQLAAFEHMASYSRNIGRFARHFGLADIVVIETAELSRQGGLGLAIARLAELVPSIHALQASVELVSKAASGHDGAASAGTARRLNASQPLPPELEPTDACVAETARSYRQHNTELFALLGKDLGWNSSSNEG